MAMPKKRSRSLVVEGQKYRWVLRGKANVTANDALRNPYGRESTLIIIVEKYENPSSRLFIHHRCSVEYDVFGWGLRREATTGEEIKVTPQQVADQIRQALKQGWNPQARAANFSTTF